MRIQINAGLSLSCVLLLSTSCADLQGRSCASDDDCVDTFVCSAQGICVDEGSEPDVGPNTVDGGGEGCADGSYDADEGPDLDCVAFTQCVAGEFVEVDGSATSDQQCAPCGDGTFSSDVDQAACTPHQICGPGTAFIAEGTQTQDRQCESCTPGSFTTADNETNCIAFTECLPGTAVDVVGTASNDRTCVTCVEGTFTAEANSIACLEWNRCVAGTTEFAAGTPQSNPSCEDCLVGTFCAGDSSPEVQCAVDTWDDDADPATPCVAHTNPCPAGTFFTSVEGTATADRGCTPCAIGFTDTLDATACTPFSDCGAGEFVGASPTVTSDRVCAQCAAGSFSTSANQAACATWSSCEAEKTAFGGNAERDQFCRETQLLGTTGVDVVSDVVVDELDRVYIAGFTNDSLSGVINAGGDDLFARRYLSDHTLDWEYDYGDATDNRVRGMAVTPTRLILAGTNQSSGARGNEVFWRVVDRDGDFNSLNTGIDDGSTSNDQLGGVVVDGDEDIYFVGDTTGDYVGGANPSFDGRGFITKFEPTGTTEGWRAEFLEPTGNVALRGVTLVNGEVVTVGELNTLTGSLLIAKRLNPANGFERWRMTYPSPSGGSLGADIATAPDGTLIVVGNTFGSLDGLANRGVRDIFVMRLNAVTGAMIEVIQIGSAEADFANAVAVHDDGRIFVVGNVRGALPGESLQGPEGEDDLALIIIDDFNDPPTIVQFGTVADDSAFDVALTSTEVVIVGRTEGDFDGQTRAGGRDGFITWITIPD